MGLKDGWGGGNLRVTGPSVIYITNHFEISGGGIVNLTGVPANCIVIAHGHDFPPGSKHDKMTVKTSGGGTLYGAMIGNTVVLSGGSAFHHDQALLRLGGGGTGAGTERLYWIEE